MPTAVRRVLVVTDVVGSTQLVAELGAERAAEMWARHDAIARELVAQFGGREIDRSDGFLLLFEEVGRAVAFAIAYHEALRGFGITARAGIHAGDVILRSNPAEQVARGAKPFEVDGVAKSIAARVASVAVGGQTLITEHVLVPNVATEARGHWRLKGIEAPIELFEVGVRGRAPFVAPPDGDKVMRVVRVGDVWVPVQEIPRQIPAERDEFVGRREDLADLDHSLGASRLVSVLGVGGTGKTRLAIRYAWTRLGDWPGGVWFCDLTEARSLDGILSVVARALEVGLTGGQPVVQLGHAIAGHGRCLLVLDNFEQVARWGSTIGAWLDQAPDVHVLITTREVLGLRGERVLALAPLPVPETVDAARDSASIQLFVERAQAASRTWRLEDADLPIAVDLVRMLEGIPLAIELAAARLRTLTMGQLLERLGDRFAMLVGSGARVDRQATLRATLDWSWGLLDEVEREALAQLNAFSGGFTLPAAEAVIDVGEPPIDVVGRLVDKSMLRVVQHGRYGMWVTVQEYVDRVRPASLDARLRHAQHFAELGTDDALASLTESDGLTRRRALGAELDNLLRACAFAVEHADHDLASRTCRAATEVLSFRGPLPLADALVRSVLALGNLDERERARAEETQGLILRLIGDPEALGHYERAVARARSIGDPSVESDALRGLGLLYAHTGRLAEARECFDRAFELSMAGGHVIKQVATLTNIGVVYMAQGDFDTARDYYERALTLGRAKGTNRFEGITLSNLGIVHNEQGRQDEALAAYDQALRIARDLDDRAAEAVTLGNIGNALLDRGQLSEARDTFEQALALRRRNGNRGLQASVLNNLAGLDLVEGREDEARAGWEQALAIAREAGHPVAEGIALGGLGEIARRRGELGVAEALVAEGERILRAVTGVRDLARLLCTKGQIADEQGHPDLARAALDEATKLADSFGAGPETELRHAIGRAEAALAHRLVSLRR